MVPREPRVLGAEEFLLVQFDFLPDVVIRTRMFQAESAADLNDIRALFIEYAHSPDWETSFATYLEQQDFDSELAQLPGTYAPPRGALLLARVNDLPAGCVACKPLHFPEVCEMKRLFVRPEFRGLGVGAQLVKEVITRAGVAGYRRMRLDTLPSMHVALRLYQRVGFYEIPPYCENPVSGAHFLECNLQTSVASSADP